MRRHLSITAKWIAVFVATTSLYWLVSNVDQHSDHIQQGLSAQLAQTQRAIVAAQAKERANPNEADGGLNLIDCTWGSPAPNAAGWLGLWLVTFVIGGVPTAVLARSAANYTKR